MSRPTPWVFGSARSVRVNVRGKKLNLLRTACRATQLVRKVVVQRTMIWTELFNQHVNIKLFAVMAPAAVRGNQIPVPFAITKRSIRAVGLHAALLSGGSYYTVNETETNHNLRGQIE